MVKLLLSTLVLMLAMGAAPVLAEGPVSPPLSGSGTGEAERIAALSRLLKMEEVFGVMAEEGKAYGADLEAQMFPGQGGARWSAIVEGIYEVPRLRAVFDAALTDALAGDDATVRAATDFFGSERGQRILTLEVEARRVLLDKAAEEAARVEAERMQAERDPRMALIRDLVEAGDLVEMNVAGALTANLAFFSGMNEVGVPGMVMDQEQMMTEVWSQEESIRDETEKWLYPYLALAYRSLSDEDLKAYVAFSASEEGKHLNAALFAAFDEVFRLVSHDLGRSAAMVMQGRDI